MAILARTLPDNKVVCLYFESVGHDVGEKVGRGVYSVFTSGPRGAVCPFRRLR